MERGLYIATTGMIHNQRRMDVVSNNMSNINTTGFKKDDVIAESFPDLLLRKINDNSVPLEGIKEVPKNIKFSQSESEKTYTIDTDGGYLRVETPIGISNGRHLQFTADKDGYLKTFYKMNGKIKTNGENYIIDNAGKRIQLQDPENDVLGVDGKGNLLVNEEPVGNLIIIPDSNIVGTINAGVREDKIVTNFNQGNFMDTGNSFDIALKGEGFMKIHSEDKGDFYTRDGSFAVDKNGELVTQEGYYVVGKYGSIMIGDNDFTVTEYGEVIVNGDVIDSLDIVDVDNKEDLRKQGNSLYKILDGIEPEEKIFEGKVVQGYLEASNVNSVRTMVEMITLMRNYESSQKVVKSFDELLGKAVNEIARF